MESSSAQWVPVHEFARKVGRPPNQIYSLIKKGNQFRKLRAEKHGRKLMVLASEVHEFPFNPVDNALRQLLPKIELLEQRVAYLESQASKS